MKLLRLVAFAAIWAAAVAPMAALENATITVSPNPLVMDRGAEINIKTSDLGSEVYLFTWIHQGPAGFSFMQWDEALQQKFAMTGSNGNYNFSIDNLAQFYGLDMKQASEVTKIGFIARSRTLQTVDLVVNVDPSKISFYSGGGEGTAASPYLIASDDDLAVLAGNSQFWQKGVYLRLDKNIGGAGISGIGSVSEPFCADFDGNGHTIDGFEVNGTTTASQPAGLFRVLGEGGRISSLGVTNAKVYGVRAAGILVGELREGSTVTPLLYRRYGKVSDILRRWSCRYQPGHRGRLLFAGSDKQ